uniref:SH3 domain-containing protein n=1 Tax=Ciona savignyi TaxID=51511 RepID=H2YQQ2_CIOSA
MVYEMMQTNRLDGAEDAFSSDHSYGDLYEKNLFQQAVYSHGDPSESGEFHMNPGDLIALTTKNFNGTYYGENQATLVYGYYPSYKVKPHPDIFVTAKQDNTQQFVHEADDED